MEKSNEKYTKKEIKKTVSFYLKNMDMNVCRKGFYYWQEFIYQIIDLEEFRTLGVYEIIADMKNESPLNVERALRHALEGIDLNKYFGTKVKVNNTVFATLLREKVIDFLDADIEEVS